MKQYPDYTPEKRAAAEAAYREALAGFKSKIAVLDDDPTGSQTVHDICVYTELTEGAVRAGFKDENGMFYLLTNSRSFSEEKTVQVHRDIAKSLQKVSGETGWDFLLISRGDSTLRGHYPLETDTLREELEKCGAPALDGCILCPFFPEGGRFTSEDIHYCKDGENYIPTGETEFAKDATFGYKASNLKDYIEEKSGGRYPAAEVLSVDLASLRALDFDGITALLLGAENFRQIVVNALDYTDLKVFAAALFRALAAGKHFLFRSAAAVPKVLGGIDDRDFLTREEMVTGEKKNGGLVVVGSHVKKTNRQLEELKKEEGLTFLEFHTEHAAEAGALEAETAAAVKAVEEVIRTGRTAVLYTGRTVVLPKGGSGEDALAISVKISEALTDVVARLSYEPAFIVAKGGITSSDVAVRGLGIRRALVLGQADKGIPVWRQGAEAKFPGQPYVVFPGNVGADDTLANLVGRLSR